MVKSFVVVLVMLPLALTLACDLVPSRGSCDLRPDEQACEDLLDNPNNQFALTFDNLCSLAGGTYRAEELCDHTGALGGCECASCENGHAVMWYFEGAEDGAYATADDVRTHCEELSREFVEP